MLSDADLNQVAADIHGCIEYADEPEAVEMLRELLADARDEALEEAALAVRAACCICGGDGQWLREISETVVVCRACTPSMAVIRALKSKPQE